MRPMPIVSVQPDWKFLAPAVGCRIGLGVSPLPQRGLDKSLSLAVGFRSVRLGADVLETQIPAGIPKSKGLITTAVVGHNASNGDAEAFVIRHCGFEKRNGAAGLLIGQDLGEGDTGMVVNADVDELPTDATTVALAGPVSGDPMADLVEAAELLDIDVDHVAGVLSLVTTHRLSRLQVAHPVQPQASQDATDSRRRYRQVRGDLFPGETLPAEGFDLFDDRRRRRSVEAFRSRRAIHQTGSAFGFEAGNPFAHRPRADACGSCGGLRRLPAHYGLNQTLSTDRRHSGILVHVHPVPPWNTEASQPQLPRSGPDGQPIESPHLAASLVEPAVFGRRDAGGRLEGAVERAERLKSRIHRDGNHGHLGLRGIG